MKNINDEYEANGGDLAWGQWLELCSVERVRSIDKTMAQGLAKSISKAMYGQLRNWGFKFEDIGGADGLVHHFDTYFLLDGTQKDKVGKKPLKKLLAYTMETGGIPLKDVICGRVFSSSCGWIRSIARDWIAVAQGWKPHSIKQNDGTRKVVWERAPETMDQNEEPFQNDDRASIDDTLDRRVLEKNVLEMINRLAHEIKVEKHIVALLFYVTAQNESLTAPEVLKVLGVGKSRAYQLKDECIMRAEKILKEYKIDVNDVTFAQILVETCEKIVNRDCINISCILEK